MHKATEKTIKRFYRHGLVVTPEGTICDSRVYDGAVVNLVAAWPAFSKSKQAEILRTLEAATRAAQARIVRARSALSASGEVYVAPKLTVEADRVFTASALTRKTDARVPTDCLGVACGDRIVLFRAAGAGLEQLERTLPLVAPTEEEVSARAGALRAEVKTPLEAIKVLLHDYGLEPEQAHHAVMQHPAWKGAVLAPPSASLPASPLAV